MRITEIIDGSKNCRNYSIELLPPLKGNSADQLFANLDKLSGQPPLFVNITTHHSEFVYNELPNGQYERRRIRRRPGTIAIAAAIRQRYNTLVVPHVICSGATIEDIEYELIDLQFLGIENLLLLRGDKARDDKMFVPTPNGHAHTTDLIAQVNNFNNGFFADGTAMKHAARPFAFGVAAYPEKHEEAPNLDIDIDYLKRKQDMGAEYAITQLFYDNRKYFDFVDKAQGKGITIPIIPGIKPLNKLSQLTVVPKTFHCDIPEALASEALKCATDDDARKVGTEWAMEQCRQLYENGVRNIHFYTMSAFDEVAQITRALTT